MARSPAVQPGVVLPQPPEKYNVADQREMRRLISEAMRRLLDWGAVVAVPPNVAALGDLDGTTNTVPYFTAPEEMALTALTAFGRSIIALTDAQGGRTLFGMPNLAQRFDVTLTSGSIADQASEVGTIDLNTPSAALISVDADQPCRLRIYSSSSARTDDASRDIDTKPTAGRGLLAEFVYDAAATIPLSPIAILANGDDPEANTVYYSLQNLSGGTTVINCSLQVLHLELSA